MTVFLKSKDKFSLNNIFIRGWVYVIVAVFSLKYMGWFNYFDDTMAYINSLDERVVVFLFVAITIVLIMMILEALALIKSFKGLRSKERDLESTGRELARKLATAECELASTGRELATAECALASTGRELQTTTKKLKDAESRPDLAKSMIESIERMLVDREEVEENKFKLRNLQSVRGYFDHDISKKLNYCLRGIYKIIDGSDISDVRGDAKKSAQDIEYILAQIQLLPGSMSDMRDIKHGVDLAIQARQSYDLGRCTREVVESYLVDFSSDDGSIDEIISGFSHHTPDYFQFTTEKFMVRTLNAAERFGNSSYVRIIIEELLNNAYKATEQSEAKVSLMVKSDDGFDIFTTVNPSLPMVFEDPFELGNTSSKNQDNRGYGLYKLKQIAIALNGYYKSEYRANRPVNLVLEIPQIGRVELKIAINAGEAEAQENRDISFSVSTNTALSETSAQLKRNEKIFSYETLLSMNNGAAPIRENGRRTFREANTDIITQDISSGFEALGNWKVTHGSAGNTCVTWTISLPNGVERSELGISESFYDEREVHTLSLGQSWKVVSPPYGGSMLPQWEVSFYQEDRRMEVVFFDLIGVEIVIAIKKQARENGEVIMPQIQ